MRHDGAPGAAHGIAQAGGDDLAEGILGDQGGKPAFALPVA